MHVFFVQLAFRRGCRPIPSILLFNGATHAYLDKSTTVNIHTHKYCVPYIHIPGPARWGIDEGRDDARCRPISLVIHRGRLFASSLALEHNAPSFPTTGASVGLCTHSRWAWWRCLSVSNKVWRRSNVPETSKCWGRGLGVVFQRFARCNTPSLLSKTVMASILSEKGTPSHVVVQPQQCTNSQHTHNAVRHLTRLERCHTVDQTRSKHALQN